MKKKNEKQILFCDPKHINTREDGTQRVALDGFPFGVACVASYLIKNSKLPLVPHIAIFSNDIFNAIKNFNPEIVCFSNYTWNSYLCYSLASLIKKQSPKTVIIFGGPHFPLDSEDQFNFLKERPDIDFYIEGEGELALLNLIESLYESDLNSEKVKKLPIPNMRAILNGRLISNEIVKRIRSLQDIPSPYLSGLLDDFFTNDYGLVPLTQYARGCPFSCTFCSEGTFYFSKITHRRSISEAREELEYIAKRNVTNKVLHIADANFGMYKEDTEIAKTIKSISEEYGYPEYISVSVGNNKKDRVLEIARILGGRMRLAGSVQSTDSEVLNKIKRTNINLEDMMSFADTARDLNANSYSEIILGLPGDTKKAYINSVKDIIEADFEHIVLYTTMLLPGTELSSKKSEKEHGLIRKYRVHPNCFGKYKFGDKSFNAAVIEEVCVAHNDLSFEDYVECRLFSFIACLFYNDRIFLELTDFLKFNDILVYDWINEIFLQRSNFSESFKKLCNNFEDDTKTELWDNSNDLINFMKTREAINKYEQGELGKNLIFYYRTSALINNFSEMNKIAYTAAKKLLSKKKNLIYDYKKILKELERYSFNLKNEFFDFERKAELTLSFNFTQLSKKRKNRNWNNIINNDNKQKFLFYHSPAQKKQIEYQINRYGNDIRGIAKGIARLPVANLYRHVEQI